MVIFRPCQEDWGGDGAQVAAFGRVEFGLLVLSKRTDGCAVGCVGGLEVESL